MADIIQELIAEISEGIHGPAQPGDPHGVVGPEAAAGARTAYGPRRPNLMWKSRSGDRTRSGSRPSPGA